MPPPLSPPPSRDCEIQRRGSLSSPTGAHTSRARLHGLHAAPHPPRAAAASFSAATRSLACLKGVRREIRAQQSKYGTSTGASRRGGQGRAQGRRAIGDGEGGVGLETFWSFFTATLMTFSPLNQIGLVPRTKQALKRSEKRLQRGLS